MTATDVDVFELRDGSGWSSACDVCGWEDDQVWPSELTATLGFAHPCIPLVEHRTPHGVIVELAGVPIDGRFCALEVLVARWETPA